MLRTMQGLLSGEKKISGKENSYLYHPKDLRSSFCKAQSLTEDDHRLLFLSADNCDIFFSSSVQGAENLAAVTSWDEDTFYPPLTV